MLEIFFCLAGAFIFIELELPTEEAAHEEKKLKSKEVESAVDYLKTLFWNYANDKEHYNYTRETFRAQVRLRETNFPAFLTHPIHLLFFVSRFTMTWTR